MRRGIGLRCAVTIGAMLALVGVIASVGVVRALDDDKLLEYSLNSIMFYDGDCTSSGGASADCGITVSGETAKEKIWTGLMSFLNDEYKAAAIMGSLTQESEFNPAKHEHDTANGYVVYGPSFNIYGNSDISYGIGLVQWSFGRRINVLKYLKEKAPGLVDKYIDKGRATYHNMVGDEFLKAAGDTDMDTLIALELCFLKKEMEENSSYRNKFLNKTYTDVVDASNDFTEYVEVTGNYGVEKPRRSKNAQGYYNEFHGRTFSSSGRAGSGGGGSLPSCSGGGNNNIAQTAVSLAWPYGHKPVSDYAKKKHYVKYHGKYKPYGDFGSISKRLLRRTRPYCHDFVATVVRYSGIDSNFPKTINSKSSSSGQYQYALKNSDKWEIVDGDWNGDTSILRAGDIVSWRKKGGGSQHTLIVIDDQNGDGKLDKAEANYSGGGGPNDMWGHIDDLGGFGKCKNGRDCWVIRAKNATSGAPTVTGEVVNNGQGNGDIGASALALAWKEGTAEGTYKKKATNAFKEYFKSLSQAAADKGTCYAGGKSCDRFVATVVRYAGVDDKMSFGPVAGGTLPYLERSSDWEEVSVGKDLSKYQSGDVLIFYKDGTAKHTAIYAVDSGGDGHVVQASNCDYYGVVKNTNAITGNYWEKIRVFRNKNNKNGGAVKCDLCSKSSSAGLVAGGMDLAKANTFMKGYHDKAMKDYFKKQIDVTFEGAKIRNAGCPYGVMNNCVAFSQWFLNRYTTIGPNWNNTTDGKLMVQKLASTQGLPTGTEPRPYAIFSTSQWGSAGHTGVVLGVNTATQKIIVGEAACSQSAGHLQYEPRAWEYTFDYVQKNGWTFAYTDSILKEGEL